MAARTVVGINFGGSASSVAVISKVGEERAASTCFSTMLRESLRLRATQEGLADCIANDDGERQISNALSFSGEEEVSRCIVAAFSSRLFSLLTN